MNGQDYERARLWETQVAIHRNTKFLTPHAYADEHILNEDRLMNRWSLSISTTAYVVLLTFGAYMCVESQNYVMAGLVLLFAFLWPLQVAAIRDKLLRRKTADRDDDTT